MRTLRQREVVAFPRSQLINGSTGDGGRQGRLASQPEVTWLWYRQGTREGLSPWSTAWSLSSMACLFPQIPRAAEALLVNGGCPNPSLVLTPTHTVSVFEVS